MNTSKHFTLHLLTPISKVEFNNVHSVTIPTDNGYECFLANHQTDQYNIIPGLCTINCNTITHKYTLQEGIASFQNNVLTISCINQTLI